MKHFHEDEFRCKCKDKSCNMDVSDALKTRLDVARDVAGVPFIITSGARCGSHNKAIGASKTSSHTKGIAADIKADNSKDRLLILRTLIETGFTRIGLGRDYIHVDLDQDKIDDVLWTYY